MRRREQSTESSTICIGNETSDEISKKTKERTNIYLIIKHTADLPDRRPNVSDGIILPFVVVGLTSMRSHQQSTKSSTTCIENWNDGERQIQ